MKTCSALLLLFVLTSSCSTGGDSAHDDKDSIDAFQGADTATQNRLNADTSANSSPSADSASAH